MGDGERTDGVWVWPDGLIHYVMVHHVPLPDAFLDAIVGNTTPPLAYEDPPPAADPGIYDFTMWTQWAAATVNASTR